MLYITYQHYCHRNKLWQTVQYLLTRISHDSNFQGTLPAVAKPLWTVHLSTAPLLFLDFLRPQKLKSLYPQSSFIQPMCVPHKSKWKLIKAPLLFSKAAIKHMLGQNVKYVWNSIFDFKICAFRTSIIKILRNSAGHLQ